MNFPGIVVTQDSARRTSVLHESAVSLSRKLGAVTTFESHYQMYANRSDSEFRFEFPDRNSIFVLETAYEEGADRSGAAIRGASMMVVAIREDVERVWLFLPADFDAPWAADFLNGKFDSKWSLVIISESRRVKGLRGKLRAKIAGYRYPLSLEKRQ